MRGLELAATVALAGCAQIGGGSAEGLPPAGPRRVTFECGDVRASASFAGSGATIQLSSGAAYTLRGVPSASGARYANGHAEFRNEGREATLTTDSLTRTCVAYGRAAVVTGSAVYRQRLALTPDAVFEATLVDASRQDSAVRVLSRWVVRAPGRMPLRFHLAYDRSRIDRDDRYQVEARILDGGQVRFTTTGSFPVLTNGSGSSVEVRLDAAGG